MPTTSGFTHTPSTLSLILTSISTSILSTLLDSKHLLPLRPSPHLFPYLQPWRALTYQVAYINSSEVLLSSIILYNAARVLERLWGTRKFASFTLVVCAVLSVLTPLAVAVLSLLTGARYNHLPAGLTGLVCAVVSCWAEEVPTCYRYQISLPAGSSSSSSSARERSTQERYLSLSEKTTVYVLTAQLSLSQFPYNILPAALGWVVGSAWRAELLPGGLGRWRVPRWMVGQSTGGKGKDVGAEYAGLRRRLEEEGASHGAVGDGMRSSIGVGTAGVDGSGGGEGRRRTGVLGMAREYFGV